MQEITIFSPFVVQRKMVGRSTIGAPVEVTSVTSHVSYADLDLTKASDAAELKKRIADSARSACEHLYAMRVGTELKPVTSTRTCIKEATAEAMAQVNDVISASNG